MNKPVLEYTCQHTCAKSQKAYLLERAPFSSKIKKGRNNKNRVPFLGEGYYFWEENIQAAHRWGSIHYKGNYSVIEFENLSLNHNFLLDFLDRRSSSYFRELKKEYIQKNKKVFGSFKLGQWIEFFKKLNKEGKIIFRYKYFRAVENVMGDINDYDNEKVNFSTDGKYYTYLSPLNIICFVDKHDITCKNKKVI
ncbi:conserved protein of unknown function [Tenacibaculum sp. 190524A02b]|uniref:hypothetical protein n=1 Tax=Tenacibaculum vairaonense TaxID=3137860 RepID=UPI0032B17682